MESIQLPQNDVPISLEPRRSHPSSQHSACPWDLETVTRLSQTALGRTLSHQPHLGLRRLRSKSQGHGGKKRSWGSNEHIIKSIYICMYIYIYLYNLPRYIYIYMTLIHALHVRILLRIHLPTPESLLRCPPRISSEQWIGWHEGQGWHQNHPKWGSSSQYLIRQIRGMCITL